VLPGDATGTNIYRVDRTTGRMRFDFAVEWMSGTAFAATLSHANTAARTYSFPNASGTVPVSATSPITLSAAGDIGLDQVASLNTAARVSMFERFF
jgi:hypothetical protein